MKNIANKIHDPYEPFLKRYEILSREIPFYSKWLRYYLDFCAKYSHTATLSNSLSHFINNLEQKNQTEQQIENRGIANLGPQIYADLRIAGLCL